MYRMFNRLPKGLEPMADIFRKHVEEEGGCALRSCWHLPACIASGLGVAVGFVCSCRCNLQADGAVVLSQLLPALPCITHSPQPTPACLPLLFAAAPTPPAGMKLVREATEAAETKKEKDKEAGGCQLAASSGSGGRLPHLLPVSHACCQPRCLAPSTQLCHPASCLAAQRP